MSWIKGSKQREPLLCRTEIPLDRPVPERNLSHHCECGAFFD
jgi:hypothetical protein